MDNTKSSAEKSRKLRISKKQWWADPSKVELLKNRNQKIGAALQGKKHTEEHIKNKSIALKKYWRRKRLKNWFLHPLKSLKQYLGRK